MLTYLSHLLAISATMMGGAFLLSSDVFGQILDRAGDKVTGVEPVHFAANVLAPEWTEGGRLYTVVEIAAQPSRFMIDTGASFTVLTPSDAERLGFRKNGAVKVDTMGGEVEMLKGRVPTMKVGEVTLADVDVLVSDELKESLLGVDTMHRLGATHLSFQPA